MTDYAELRAALEMGPTPGPFSASRSYSPGNQELILRLTYKDEYGLPEHYCTVRSRLGGELEAEANAALIAACDPDTIRALLAERDALREALEDELIWHEAQDKAISKQPNANTGHNWWRRMQHQEHAAVIRAALGQGQGGSDAPEV